MIASLATTDPPSRFRLRRSSGPLSVARAPAMLRRFRHLLPPLAALDPVTRVERAFGRAPADPAILRAERGQYGAPSSARPIAGRRTQGAASYLSQEPLGVLPGPRKERIHPRGSRPTNRELVGRGDCDHGLRPSCEMSSTFPPAASEMLRLFFLFAVSMTRSDGPAEAPVRRWG